MKVDTATRLKELEEYYFSRKLEQIRQLEVKGHDVINLGIGSPDLPPHPEVVQELVSSAQLSENHGYQSYKGIPELRTAFADFMLRHFEVSVDAGKHVLPLIGSKEGITHISLAYLNKGDQVLIPSLGYPTYTSVTRMVEAEPIYYPLSADRNWQPDWDFLESLDTSKVKLFWVNYPHMPTGAEAETETLEKLVAYAKDRNFLICHDNPYAFILNDNRKSLLQFDPQMEVTLELHSLSKSFNMAGWRVGWVCGSEQNIQSILKIKSNVDSGSFRPIQLAAIKAVSLADEWFEKLNGVYRNRKRLVHTLLDKLGCTYSVDQKGMFVWAKVKDGSGEQLSDEILEKYKVFITPGFIFGESGEQFIRISLCTPENRLQEVLNRLEL